MTSYQPRELTPRLLRTLRHWPIIVLSGLRQVGKSTLLQREQPLVEGRAYRTLDDFATLAAARANPEALLAEAVILDEVQHCPELLLALKGCVDQDRRTGRSRRWAGRQQKRQRHDSIPRSDPHADCPHPRWSAARAAGLSHQPAGAGRTPGGRVRPDSRLDQRLRTRIRRHPQGQPENPRLSILTHRLEKKRDSKTALIRVFLTTDKFRKAPRTARMYSCVLLCGWLKI